MRRVFADAAYWIALANPHDNLHKTARDVSKELGNVRIFTSEIVLTEVLNSLGGKGEVIGKTAAKMVERILTNANVEVLPQTSALFREALTLYCERPERDWGLTDCSSVIIMKDKGLSEILTPDHHFAEAGFKTLLESE
jgi:predicted nucleic acid-binding protein